MQRSHILLELLRERMALRDQELTSPPKEMPVISRALPLRPTLAQEPTIIMPTTHNLKGEYREPSAEEVRREKKKEAKQRKKESAALQAENDKFQSSRSEIKVIGEETSLEESAKEIAPVQIGGNFKTFERLMNQTYKGPIEKVVLLFERLGGNVEKWHSGSRIKFSLPHFANLKTELLDVLPPQTEDEAIPEPVGMSTEEAVFHGPHKQKSNKLRPYHVNDIREMLIKTGYNEKTVVKKIQ
ncbi:MAG: hypothetical protein JSR85_06220 [Proteobacteria bacterium]|nr:hypothetical protein [Pseudomonadota bacterium]